MQALEIHRKIKQEQERTKTISMNHLTGLINQFQTMQATETDNYATTVDQLNKENEAINTQVVESQKELDLIILAYEKNIQTMSKDITSMQEFSDLLNSNFNTTYGNIDNLKTNIDTFIESAKQGMKTHSEKIESFKNNTSATARAVIQEQLKDDTNYDALRDILMNQFPKSIKTAHLSMQNMTPSLKGKSTRGGARKQPNSKKHIRKSSKKTKKKKSKKPTKPKKPAKKK